MAMFRELPIAWLQLSHGRTKLVAAVVGISRADGPSRPACASGACVFRSADITASSCSWLQEKTASSLL